MARKDVELIPPLTLSADQKKEQLDEIVRFLSLVHPSLLQADADACVELRGIARDYHVVPFVIRRQSFSTWQLRDKDISMMGEWLSNRNGLPICLYYSAFTYNYGKQTYTKSGKVAQKGKITVDGAMFVEELPLDFDHCDEILMHQYDSMLRDIGIHALWTSSGHGYQCHILLADRIYNKELFKFLVHLVISKGFTHVDPACQDAARVMRLPYTFNCKCFESHSKYISERSNPPMCHVVKANCERISYDKLVEAFMSLPTVDEKEFNIALTIRDAALGHRNSKSDTEARKQSVRKEQEIPEYPTEIKKAIKDGNIPEAVVNALTYTPQGCRHDTLIFLINFLSRYVGLSAAVVRKTLTIWNETACTPSLDNFDCEYSAAWLGNRKYNLKKVAKQHGKNGYIDLAGYNAVKRKSEIKIPNTLFDAISDIGTACMKVFIALGMAEHDTKSCTVEEIAEYAHFSCVTTRKCLKALKSKGFVYVIQGHRSAGVPDTYHLNRVYAPSVGYYSLRYLVAEKYMTLHQTELCLLLLLDRECNKQEKAIVCQSQIGKLLGSSQQNVSRLMSDLVRKGFITIDHEYVDKVICRCVVDINF